MEQNCVPTVAKAFFNDLIVELSRDLSIQNIIIKL